MICQGLETFHRVRRGQLLSRRLVEKAVHIATQAVKCTLAAIHLDGPVKSGARLNRHIAVTEEDEVPHQTSSTKLGGDGLLCNQLGVVGLTVVFHVMGVEVMEGFPRPGRLMHLPLPSLQDVVQLEAHVINLGVPLGGHHFWEGPGVTACFREVENHVLDQRAAEDVVVLEGRALVQQLVVLAGSAAAIEGLPVALQVRLLLGVVVLAFRILHGTGQMVVVEVVLLDESLPVLVCIEPFRLRQHGDGRILK
mmetsp:Transcript_27936/g.52376  ORF Transcript_27936/g.52376 Transcript_27936/m.52376 type:complete len:251 (-) Transcript_27936:518-1270(-)